MAPRNLILLIALAAPSTSVDAGPPSAFSKDKKPGQALPYRAVGTWGVPALGRQFNVHWQCQPFSLEEDDHFADVQLSLFTDHGSGPVKTQVLNAHDTTNLKKRHKTARVSASVGGRGVAYFKIALEIEGDDHPAGTYGSVVDVTVTSH